jgi:sigma-B regulation protein RsbQ
MTDVLARNAVTIMGNPDGQPMMFAHGFGCDQSMWRLVTPDFAADHKIVLFDLVGSGRSDLSAYDPAKYGDLTRYAQDLIEVASALSLQDIVLVGHSVSSMIAALAATLMPELFDSLVMVGPSASYINDGDYVGGFSSEDIHELLVNMDHNYLDWAAQMAPAIMGNPDRPELAGELTNSFCNTDPVIARHFARTTFLGDNRLDMSKVTVRTLVMQVRHDAIAPVTAGSFVHANLPHSEMVVLDTNGHCPHLSAPEATSAAIRGFLSKV